MEFIVGKLYKIVAKDGAWSVVQCEENDNKYVTSKHIGFIIKASDEEFEGKRVMLNDYTIRNFEVTNYREPTPIKYTPELCDLFLYIAVEIGDKEWFDKLHKIKKGKMKNVL